jgi:hypothetical protein
MVRGKDQINGMVVSPKHYLEGKSETSIATKEAEPLGQYAHREGEPGQK